MTGRVSPFEALGPDWTLEDPTPAGLVVVDLHFVGSEHVVFEEYQQAIFSGYPFSGRKTLVEAAALASFGSSENLCPAGGSPGRHSPASSGGGSDAGKSPPGSFPYEMYHYLAKKVTSPGGERAARKQRRRDRDRALTQGRRRYESEHFVKIPHFCPTREQPLQGLWKVRYFMILQALHFVDASEEGTKDYVSLSISCVIPLFQELSLSR